MTKFGDENIKINNMEKSDNDEYIDIHCHCLPAIDDGPKTIYDALTLCRMLIEDGITTVIATPHQLGQFDGCNEAKEIREAVSMLNKELEAHHIPLTITPGGDVRLDERICKFLEDDRITTLADGGKYILLELPSEVLIDIEPLLADLACRNVKAIISHPERHFILNRHYDIIPKWLNQSAFIQITAGSLLGDFGRSAEKAAWQFLKEGWVSFVATDSHNTSRRRPRMKAAFRNINMEMGQPIAHLLCKENPLRILEGRDILTAPINRQKEHSNAES
ncbi:MAG: hypothetical protein JW715_14780 [Sedimentisphaerales bacterium]|nr:hypothetical protein [Sedimentisphaerales bacterium]